jgi:hypothetical protein
MKVGGKILPPSETGFSPTSADINGAPPEGKTSAYRPDRVYATTNREFAEVFATLYTQNGDRPGTGMVYEVELEDTILDPDMSTFEEMFEGTSARIVKPGRPVRTSTKRLRELLQYFQRRGALVNAERDAAAAAEAKAEDPTES